MTRQCTHTFLIATLFLFVAPHAQADKRSKDARAEAVELTREALYREVYADQEERDKLLSEALQADPDYAPARWHQGFVNRQNRWEPVDRIPSLNAEDGRLTRYEFVRDKTPDTLEGHFELAEWCRKKGLDEQQRAHLTRVLDFDSNHAAARRQLGFRRIRGTWVSQAEAQQSVKQRQTAAASLDKWSSKLEALRKTLNSKKGRRLEFAAQQLRTVDDVTAIPTLEAVFMNDSAHTGQLMVEVLGKMPQFQAAHALARVAVLSPWPQVRHSAATALQSRKLDTFAPVLVAELYTPVASRTRILPGPGGRLIYRHEFIREGQGERQHMVLDTAYRRRARPGGNRNETLSRAILDVFFTQRARTRELDRQNAVTQELNDRISSALSIATKRNLGAEPAVWWKWWNDYNEVFVKSEKGVNGIYRTEEITLTDISNTPTSPSGGGFRSSPPPAASFDCLAAGTKVWTNRGPQQIERVRVGDLMLSQDPDSGELAYKPVVRTTIRPKGRLVKIRAGKDVIETSGGHLFWTAGDGWVKARDLRSGMVLHGSSGVAHVSTVEMSGEAETYNVIVADFHTYFVGEGKVMSHDNTVRRPTNATVPGLLID